MREIKFRVWMLNDENPNGKMYYLGKDTPFVINLGGDVIQIFKGLDFQQVKSDCYWARVGNNNIQLMQYTGLKDKNGKEIYEGDVVMGQRKISSFDLKAPPIREYRGKIEFRHGCFMLRYISRNGNKLSIRITELDSSEVIGNIYENPELLEA